MTETEIMKALEQCMVGVCDGCQFEGKKCEENLHKAVLDLINRKNAESAEKDAEIKRLTTLAELGNMRANDYRVMRDRALKAEAEIERVEYTLLGVMHSVDKWLDGDELKQDEVNRAATMREKTLRIIETARAEAIKEFLKKAEEKMIVVHGNDGLETAYLEDDLHQIAKEMGVEL